MGHSDDEYAKLLKSEQLLPIDPDLEQDWSGRGQHTKFDEGEDSVVNGILRYQKTLGHSRAAVVQSVKCRRISLARKTIRCAKTCCSCTAFPE